MSGLRISVIIPVYNASAFLEQCVLSVLHQTYRDIEIIAVNDGSTDDSGELLDKLAAGAKHIKVLHTKNRGVSAARNLGLMHASGDYIGFVDADDWIEPIMYETMFNALLREKGDWVICNISNRGFGIDSTDRLKLEEGVVDSSRNKALEIKKAMRFTYDYANWNKLFSANIIKAHQLAFEDRMFLWEDLLFNLKYLQFAKKTVVVNQSLYNYRIHSNSITKVHSNAMIPQFNFLFDKYRLFTNKYDLKQEWQIFEAEMARCCYYQLLERIAEKQRKQSGGFFQLLNNFYRSLKEINPQIFRFKDGSLVGLQGIKKKLLMKQWYYLFSLITVASFCFRKKVL